MKVSVVYLVSIVEVCGVCSVSTTILLSTPMHELLSNKLITFPLLGEPHLFWLYALESSLCKDLFPQWFIHHLLLLWKFLCISSFLLLFLWLSAFINRTSFLLTVPMNIIKMYCQPVVNMPLVCIAWSNRLTQNALNLFKHAAFMTISIKSYCHGLMQKKVKQCHKVRHWTVWDLWAH